jgi:hypothetical protein
MFGWRKYNKFISILSYLIHTGPATKLLFDKWRFSRNQCCLYLYYQKAIIDRFSNFDISNTK